MEKNIVAKTEIEKYDLVVIGGGPSGYAGAMRAVDFGKKVLIVEKDKIGGAGIYNGALWSKAMWEFSQKVMVRRDAEKERFEGVTFEEMMHDVNGAIFDRKLQMTLHMSLLQSETINKNLHYEKGTAEMVDKNHVKIHKTKGD